MFRPALFILAMLSFITPLSLSAAPLMTEQTDPLFTVKPELIKSGEVHFAWVILPARKMARQLARAKALDGARFLQNKKATLQLTKLAYVVNRPVGFFSSTQVTDPAWLAKLLGTPLEKVSEDRFTSRTLGKVRVYFDSDDLSSLQSTHFIHAVAESKKIDPLALSAFSSLIIHSKDFMQLDNHISLSPNKTLVVSYQFNVVEIDREAEARQSFLVETQARLMRVYP